MRFRFGGYLGVEMIWCALLVLCHRLDGNAGWSRLFVVTGTRSQTDECCGECCSPLAHAPPRSCLCHRNARLHFSVLVAVPALHPDCRNPLLANLPMATRDDTESAHHVTPHPPKLKQPINGLCVTLKTHLLHQAELTGQRQDCAARPGGAQSLPPERRCNMRHSCQAKRRKHQAC